MGVSYYYSARREAPLSESERKAIAEVEKRYAVEDRIERYAHTGAGPNWESFCIYDSPTAPNMIFEGATRLPDNSEEHLLEGLKHWTEALSEIRRIVPNAEWSVTIDDVEIPWDEDDQAFDPWNAG